MIGPPEESLLPVLLGEHVVRLLDMIGEAVQGNGLEADLALDHTHVVRVV